MSSENPASLRISCDRHQLDVALIHHFLSGQSAWAAGIPLATADAHGLYAQFGFTPLAKPQTFMERYQPAIYKSPG